MSEQERIERVARALCKADGKNPDDIGSGAMERGPEQVPNWQDYEQVAKRFIAAFDAAKEDIALPRWPQ